MKNYNWSVSAVGHPQAEKDLGLTTDGFSVGINSLVVSRQYPRHGRNRGIWI